MLLISKPTHKEILLERHNTFFKTMIKAVIDIKKEILTLDAELHADLENRLLHEGSEPENLWGINLFLEKEKQDWIDFTALINIRPSMSNRSMDVENAEIRQKIANIVHRLIVE